MPNTDPTLELLKSQAQEAGEFVEKTLEERRLSVLTARLKIGQYQHRLRKHLPSNKLYGIQLALDIPATAKMDPALLSNQKWLYEALHIPGHKGNDILEVLGITGIEGFKSDNPTVIRRQYRKKKNAHKAKKDKGQTGNIANTMSDDAILPASAIVSFPGIEAPAFEEPTKVFMPTRKLPRIR